MERIQGHGNPAHPARQPGHTHTRIPESAPRTKRNPESATTSPANHGSGSDAVAAATSDGRDHHHDRTSSEIPEGRRRGRRHLADGGSGYVAGGTRSPRRGARPRPVSYTHLTLP